MWVMKKVNPEYFKDLGFQDLGFYPLSHRFAD